MKKLELDKNHNQSDLDEKDKRSLVLSWNQTPIPRSPVPVKIIIPTEPAVLTNK
jgi:hypothetical protein